MGQATVTDADGKYTITGKANLPYFTATLVVARDGFVPAMGWFGNSNLVVAGIPAATQPAGPSVRDLVMTRRGGALDVRVMMDDKPVVGAEVRLEREGGQLRDTWAKSLGGQGHEEVNAVAFPAALSGQDGVARFERLIPGRYQIKVNGPPKEPIVRERAEATAVGVNVRLGQTTSHRMSLVVQADAFKYRAIDLHDKPIAGKTGQLTYGLNGSGGWMTHTEADDNGMAVQDAESPGLWHIEVKHQKQPGTVSSSLSDGETPYDAAEGLVGVSALLDVKAVPTFKMRTIRPAKVYVQTPEPRPGLDLHSVTIDRVGVWGDFSSPIAGRNQVEFPMVAPGQWRAKLTKGVLEGLIPHKAVLPKDEELSGKVFCPYTTFTTQSDEEVRVKLEAVPAGYVRGRIRPLPKHRVDEYSVESIHRAQGPEETICDDTTGEFVAGPFASGPVSLAVFARNGKWSLLHVTVSATAQGGKVVQLGDVTPPETPVPYQQYAMLGMQGITALNPGGDDVCGKVFLPDGKTPAAFARVAYFSERSDQAVGDGLTDAAGNIHTHGTWAASPLIGARGTRAVLAFVPGTSSGVLVSLDHQAKEPLSIRLPEPRSMSGRVTVGKQSPRHLRGQIRVFARHKQGGRQYSAADMMVSPQDDGTFVIGGVSTGEYEVQAAIDGIWLSRTATLTVADRDVQDVDLDIAEPAGPVQILVLDSDGKPLSRERVVIDRPPGPMRDLCWPKSLMTDGAGVVYIPALESASHRVTAVGRTIDVTPPPAHCDGPQVYRCLKETSGK